MPIKEVLTRRQSVRGKVSRLIVSERNSSWNQEVVINLRVISGSRGSFRRQQQRLSNPSRSRPMGGIEKVIEYRQVPNSGGSVELRRVTPSVDGPIEHIDVVEPIHQETASQR